MQPRLLSIATFIAVLAPLSSSTAFAACLNPYDCHCQGNALVRVAEDGSMAEILELDESRFDSDATCDFAVGDVVEVDALEDPAFDSWRSEGARALVWLECSDGVSRELAFENAQGDFLCYDGYAVQLARLEGSELLSAWRAGTCGELTNSAWDEPCDDQGGEPEPESCATVADAENSGAWVFAALVLGAVRFRRRRT